MAAAHRRSMKDQIPAKGSDADALPLPLYLANAVVLPLFFSTVYYLLLQWREKIRNSTPLHVLNLSEISAILIFFASFIYLLAFIFPRSDILDDEEIVEELEDSSAAVSPSKNKIMDNELPSTLWSESDEEIVKSVVEGKIPSYALESKLGDCGRAAAIRREALQRITGKSLEGLPLEGFNYDAILGQCCEMPVGYVQIPVGIAGPLLLNDVEYSVPMATTEGCLIASTNRGCKAIYVSGGATCTILRDGMTRAPVVRFATARRAAELKFFLEDPLNFETLSHVFNSSSRFGRLQTIRCAIAGKNLYMRFTCSTGDAMGMNMVSKGVQNVMDFLTKEFPDMDVIGISGKGKCSFLPYKFG